MRAETSGGPQWENWRFSAIFSVWHAPCNISGMADGMVRTAGSGRLKMTFNINSLQHIAVSAIGAIFAASLFITAAVGPAGQIL